MKLQIKGKTMNRIIMMMLAFVFCAFLGGCAATVQPASSAGIPSRQDVFAEHAPGQPPPPGYAELRIMSSIKTHKPGWYFGKDSHGTKEYELLLNIGGQIAVLAGDLREENRESGGPHDPESGEGIRYHFMRSLHVKAGAHRIVVALPVDNIAIEREMALSEGSTNILLLEPVYRPKPVHRRITEGKTTSFRQGVKMFRLVLNGTPL